MGAVGITKVCTIRSILDAVETAGGSARRIFKTADLSPRLVEDPNQLILLKDQFALLDAAAREIGDAAVAARMSMMAGIDGLGSYGRLVAGQPTLNAALAVARERLPGALQTATRVALNLKGKTARWSYVIDDPSIVGRQHNEVLCIGYVLSVLRRFGGPGWTPQRVTITGSRLEARRAVEDVLDCSVELGEITEVCFPADLLDAHNVAPMMPLASVPLPDPKDTAALVSAVIASDLFRARPNLKMIAQRLGVPPRSLQRRLAKAGTTFESLLDATLAARAKILLDAGMSITAVAYELGFAEPAHFSRAFRRWTGQPPKIWRDAIGATVVPA